MKIKPNWWRRVVLLVVVLAIIAGSIYLVQNLTKTAALPGDIKRVITFSSLIIPNSQDFRSRDFKLSNTDDGTPLLSYVVVFGNTTITISEYPQPSIFTEIPDYKDKFLENKKDTTISTANGTIYLTKLDKQDNKTAGLMLEKGLIVLMNPDKELSETDWRKIGDSFELVKQ